MKKRILALALAGTTAFSVFGAAMSANAAWWDDYSSHIGANDDAYYKHYNPAGEMHWSLTSGSISAAYISYNADGFNPMDIYTVGEPEIDHIKNAENMPETVLDTIAQGTTLYVQNPTACSADETYYNIKNVTELPGYEATLDDYMDAKHYNMATSGDLSDGKAFFMGKDGNNYGLYVNSNGDYFAYALSELSSVNMDGLTPVTGLTSGSHIYYHEDADGSVSYNGIQLYDGSKMNLSLTAMLAKETSNSYYIAELVNDNHENGNNYFKYDGQTSQVCYVYKYSADDLGQWTDARYNSLDATDPENFDAVMANPVESSGEIYLYDYAERLPWDVSWSEFARAWNNREAADFMAEEGYANWTGLVPEDGYTREGLRGDVIYAWEDFLDEIGLYNGTGSGPDGDYKVSWAENMINNYAYTYYEDDVIVEVDTDRYDDVVIYYVASKDVDVYNFAELIKNIVNTADRSDIENAQTSEMVYLMQQYNKYMDGYVEVKPAETDEWGDLLVSLLEAPTEDDFRTANSYKRFVDKAEELIENYQDASTYMNIQAAEEAMYDFITGQDGWNGMDDNRSEDTSGLAAAIDSATFNYNWQRSYNSDNPAGIYVGTIDTDGYLDKNPSTNYLDSDLGAQRKGTMTWDPQAWALYPQDDYVTYDRSTYKYPGVDGGVSNVDATYGWFVNVYELAYDVYVGNDFQGTLDVMAEALNEAIAALTPTENAKASDVLGAEEANGDLTDLIETDYTAAMWDNRDKIYNFITERVVNDEIGETGTNNAEDIAELMATHLGYQRNQSNVTRTDINEVKTAKSEAETALKALQDDEDNYNAAQANALEKAIDDCQYLIDLYEGDYSLSSISQSVNTAYNGAVGDKDQILKSDCDKAVEAVDAAINFKNVIQGWTETDNGWMYGVEDTYDSDLTWGVEDTLTGPHYLNFGWAKIGNTWFYFDEEGIALESDWLQVGNDWYYFNSNCGAAIGWAKVDGQWYYFNQGCKMMTGWQKVDGNWYYLKPSGAMATGWCQVDGKWYYLSTASNSLGQMYYSTTTPDGYKVDASGALVE